MSRHHAARFLAVRNGPDVRALLARLAHRLFPGLTRSFINARTLAYGHGQMRDTASNAAGEAIPWYTYPATEYLSQFDVRGASVFEFGAGHSSLFWAARARRVCSVEMNPEWHATLAAYGRPNLELFLREDKARYLSCLAEQGEKFDLIVIDGRWRQSCAALAPSHLRDGGMVVLDNSDRYPETARALRHLQFFQIDFSGFGPLNAYAWTTSIFLRADCRLQQGFSHPSPIGAVRENEREDG
jgi:hypothetical protein